MFKISRRGSGSPDGALVRPFWIGLVVFVGFLFFTAHPQNVESTLGGLMIIGAGCIPFGLWAVKQMRGLPIFPIFALTHVWAFGVPFLYEHPIVIKFEPERQILAAVSVTGFLVISTAVWYAMRLKPKKPPQRFWSLESSLADAVFLGVLAGSIGFTLALNGWWVEIPFGLFAIVRSVMLSCETLSCFALSYRLGTGDLTGSNAIAFKVLVIALLVASLPSLYLVTSICIIGISVLGYMYGSGRLPWSTIILGGLLISFLHAGKSDMRQEYWEEQDTAIQPWEYASFLGKWGTSATDALFGDVADEDEKPTSVVERSSLLQLLLYEQDAAYENLPFLNGETYIIIPELLIPRIIYPDKPEAHAGTHLLNVHYGLQTQEESEHTTIGFGLLNESFANFGYPGIVVLAVILGAFYGWVESLGVGVPLLSFRGLFVVIVASEAFQVEHAAGVWASALFQSTVALTALSLLLMRIRTARSASQRVVFALSKTVESAPASTK